MSAANKPTKTANSDKKGEVLELLGGKVEPIELTEEERARLDAHMKYVAEHGHQPSTRTVDDALKHLLVVHARRTRYHGQAPRDDELLVEEINLLRGLAKAQEMEIARQKERVANAQKIIEGLLREDAAAGSVSV